MVAEKGQDQRKRQDQGIEEKPETLQFVAVRDFPAPDLTEDPRYINERCQGGRGHRCCSRHGRDVQHAVEGLREQARLQFQVCRKGHDVDAVHQPAQGHDPEKQNHGPPRKTFVVSPVVRFDRPSNDVRFIDPDKQHGHAAEQADEAHRRVGQFPSGKPVQDPHQKRPHDQPDRARDAEDPQRRPAVLGAVRNQPHSGRMTDAAEGPDHRERPHDSCRGG